MPGIAPSTASTARRARAASSPCATGAPKTAVADMLVDIAALGVDNTVDGLEIESQYGMQLLRIDLPAELREAAEIGEHHGDLSPFAGREIDRAAFSKRSRLRLAKSRDGINQLAAVAYSGDAKVPKILGCEPGQDRAIDTIPVVLPEGMSGALPRMAKVTRFRPPPFSKS